MWWRKKIDFKIFNDSRMYLLYKSILSSYFIWSAYKTRKTAMEKIPLMIDIYANSRESRLEDNGTRTITPSLLPAPRDAVPSFPASGYISPGRSATRRGPRTRRKCESHRSGPWSRPLSRNSPKRIRDRERYARQITRWTNPEAGERMIGGDLQT